MKMEKQFLLTLEFDEHTRWLSDDGELVFLLRAVSRAVAKLNTEGSEPKASVSQFVPEEKLIGADDLCGIGMHDWRDWRAGNRQCKRCGLVWHSTHQPRERD